MTGSNKKTVAIYLKMINQMGPTVRNAEAQLGGFRKRVHRDFVMWGSALALVVAGALTASANVGAGFEQSLANTGAVARATAGEMAALEEKARSLGETTAFTAGQAADAMYSLSSGGLDVTETIAASEPVLKLAGATLTSMGEAAELTMGSMKMFGLQAEDSNRIVNVFAAGIQNSMLNMQRLSDSMTYAGPIASSVGMSIEQTTAALGLLHNAGLKGSIAGTGLRMMLMKLQNPSKDLKRALGGLTVEAHGLGAVLDQLRSSGIDLATSFDARAFGAVNALVREGSEGFEEMTDKVTGTNAAYDMYNRQMATTSSKIKMMKSAIQEDMIAVFFRIKPTLDSAIKSITEFVKSSKNQLIGMAEDLVNALENTWAKLNTVFEFMRSNMDTIKNVALAVGAIAAAFYGLSVAVGIANSVMAISPLTWVAGALVLIAIQLTDATQKTNALKDAWSGLNGVFDSFKQHQETIKRTLHVVGMLAAGAIVLTRVVKGLAWAFRGLKAASLFLVANPIAAIFIAIAASITVGIVKMGGFRKSWIKVSWAAKAAWIHITGGAKKAWARIKQFGSNVASVFRAMWNDWDWLRASWGWLSKAARVSSEWITGALKKVWEQVKGGKNYVDAIGKTFSAVFGAIFNTIKDFATKAGMIFKNLGRMIMKPWKAKEIWGDLKASLEGGLDNAFGGVGDLIAGYWKDAGTKTQVEIDKISKETQENLARIKAERDAALAAVDAAEPTGDLSSNVNLDHLVQKHYDNVLAKYRDVASKARAMVGTMPFVGAKAENDLQATGDAGSKAMSLIQDSARSAMDGVSNSIANAVMSGKGLLESLGNVGKSVFGSLLSGFLKMGLGAGLNLIAPGLGTAMGLARAGGGPASQNNWYRVNEYGQEFFKPSGNGQIIPVGGAKASSSGGDTHIHLSMSLPSSSLLLADNDAMVRRFGEKILNVVKPKLDRTHRLRGATT